MLLSQIRGRDGSLTVVAREGTEAYAVTGAGALRSLALEAARAGQTLAAHITALGLGRAIDLGAAHAEGRVLAPIHHPDPAHLHVTGTGLAQRDPAGLAAAMAGPLRADLPGQAGADAGIRPGWYYAGNGLSVIDPGGALLAPVLLGTGAEEPEVAGIYVIGDDGTPLRVGFALCNAFAEPGAGRGGPGDAGPAPLRPVSFGPEILTGALPRDIRGTTRIRRGARLVCDYAFLSGERNMPHAVDTLEQQHFRHHIFRTPGDVHVHMLGCTAGTCPAPLQPRDGDIFEVEAPGFGLPLRNALRLQPPVGSPAAVAQL